MYSEKYESKETLGNLSSCPVSILVSVLTILMRDAGQEAIIADFAVVPLRNVKIAFYQRNGIRKHIKY